MTTVFFSDFDGTITEKDVIESIMEEFAPAEWKTIHNDLINGIIDIDVGIRKMFNLIPSDKKEEIIKWVKNNIKIRDGFKEFLKVLKKRNIPFVILSGGIDFYIYPLLEKYLHDIYKIHCNRATFNKEYIDVFFTYRCLENCRRNCGICKPYIIENYYHYFLKKIYAGDGITDIDSCQYGDIIFSTGKLTEYLNDELEGKRVINFNNFFDILNNLEKEKIIF